MRIYTPRMCYPDEIGLEAKFAIIPGAILNKNVYLANSSNCFCKYSRFGWDGYLTGSCSRIMKPLFCTRLFRVPALTIKNEYKQ